MNFRPSHIPFDRLVDWVEERLTPAESTQLRQHLDDCASCREELAQVEQLLGLMQSDSSVDPPPAVVNRALRIFRPRPAPTMPLLQRIVAALQFDSIQLTPLVGVRSGAIAPRQLLFSAGDYDLDLRLTPTEIEENWILSGQLLGADPITGHIELRGATISQQAPLTAPGEFRLPPVAAGVYALMIYLPAQEITVELLQVGG